MSGLDRPIPTLWTLCALLTLGGCKVGPNYEAPQPEVPDTWTESVGTSTAHAGTPWWTAFGDPRLSEFVERARERNYTLAEALAGIRKARRGAEGARASLRPRLGADAEAVDRRTSARSFESFPLPPGAEVERDERFYRVGLDTTWEVDLFGKNRRAVEAAVARLGGAEATYEAALLSVTAETARAYLELLGARARLAAAQRNAELRDEALRIVRDKDAAGLATPSDVARAQADREVAWADLPLLRAEVRQWTYQLGVFTALAPAEISARMEAGGSEVPLVPRWVSPAKLPVEVIRQRPDVRIAEREWARQTAEVGVATANLYPQVELNALLFAEASTVGGLGEGSNQGNGLIGGVLAPLWQGGRLRARLAGEEADEEAAAARFRQAVLEALADVETALSLYRESREALSRRAAARKATREAERLTRHRYETGLTELLEWTEAQSLAARADRQWAAARTRFAVAAVTLNKALGRSELGEGVP
jgi:NodT family efflux transporter outer membrane factor (OMF) lipoprotein